MMNLRITQFRPGLATALAGFSLSCSATLRAANRTWDGGGTNDNWDNGANWNGRTAAPDPGAHLTHTPDPLAWRFALISARGMT